MSLNFISPYINSQFKFPLVIYCFPNLCDSLGYFIVCLISSIAWGVLNMKTKSFHYILSCRKSYEYCINIEFQLITKLLFVMYTGYVFPLAE